MQGHHGTLRNRQTPLYVKPEPKDFPIDRWSRSSEHWVSTWQKIKRAGSSTVVLEGKFLVKKSFWCPFSPQVGPVWQHRPATPPEREGWASPREQAGTEGASSVADTASDLFSYQNRPEGRGLGLRVDDLSQLRALIVLGPPPHWQEP